MKVGPVGSYPVPSWNRSINRTGRLRNFRAPEFKYQAERVTQNEIKQIREIKNGKKESPVKPNKKRIENSDKGKWIKSLYTSNVSYGQLIVQIQTGGFTPIESKEIVDESIHQSERATDWAISNGHYAGIAEKSALIAALAGIGSVVLKNLEENNVIDDSPVLKRSLNVIENVGSASRGYIQYEKIYGGRNDDDRARNNYEAEVYGNKVAGIFANLAYIFETNINPVALVALGFTNEKVRETIQPILALANPLWWRVRMLAEIDQKFGTDLFTYLINKPLALLNIESAVKKVMEIRESGFLNYPYVSERLVELIGLNPKEHKLRDVFPEVAKLLKQLFSKDHQSEIESSEKLGKLLAPIFGFYGFVAYGLGVPVKSILTWLDKESKWVNLIAKSGSASQQITYLFRMILHEQFQNNSVDSNNLSPEAKRLKQERTRLFHAGVSVCVSNVLSSILQLIDTENSNIAVKTAKEIVEKVAEKGINYYFSKRRKLLGKRFRLDNPELYNIDGTAKIISDKVKIEDEKELAAKAA